MVSFTEEILNGKLHFLCRVTWIVLFFSILFQIVIHFSLCFSPVLFIVTSKKLIPGNHSQTACSIISLFQWKVWYRVFFLLIRAYTPTWKVSVFRVLLVGIQSECWKIRTRKSPNTDNFYAVLGCYLLLDVFIGSFSR